MSATAVRLRPRIPYNLSVITLVLINLALGAEILIIANYVGINQAITASLTAADRLPQLADLRLEVLRLDAETSAALGAVPPEFGPVDAQQAVVSERLEALRATAEADEAYAPALEALETMLRTQEARLSSLRSTPPAGDVTGIRRELRGAFGRAEAALDDLYEAEAASAAAATTGALATLRSVQGILLGASAMILLLGGVLIFILRRAARAEMGKAYDQLQAASEVGRAASSILDLDQLFATALRLIPERFAYDYAAIYLMDQAAEHAVLREATGEEGRRLKERGQRFPVDAANAIGRVLAERAPVVVDDVLEDPSALSADQLPGLRSRLALPLIVGDELVGVLDVQAREAFAFAESDVNGLQTLADQLAVAIANAGQYRREQIRTERMAGLSQAAMEVSGPQLKQREQLELIARRAMELLAADGAGLWLPVGLDEVELKLSRGAHFPEANASGQTGAGGALRFRKGEGLTGQVFATGHPLRVDDYRTWVGRHSDTAPFHAALSLPLLWQSEVIGLLALTRTRPGHVFTEDDESLGQLFASQAASALENARLFAESQRRAAQLAVSAEVARVATTLHDLPELLRTTVALIGERFDFYHAGIFLLDDAREWAVLQAANSPGGQRMLARGHRLRVGRAGIVGYVTSTGHPRIAQDVGGDTVHLFNPDLPDTRSEMAVPLTVRGSVIGALDVQSVAVNAFGEDDVNVLLILADQLGVAIDNARLFHETRAQLDELRALQREARQRFGLGAPEEPRAFIYDGLEVRSAPTVGVASDAGAEVLRIPLRMGDEALGELALKREGGQWSAEERTLSEAIAERMALALENARLFETTRTSLAETERLYNAGRAIAAARTLDDILHAIMAYAPEPHHRRFLVGFVDVDEGQRVTAMRVAAEWEATGGAQYGQGQRYAAERFPLLGRIGLGAPTVVVVGDATGLDAQSRAFFQAQGLAAAALVPLVAGGALIGVFIAGTQDPHEFTEDEFRPLQALANQAATAIDNLRLLEQTQRRVAELATVNSISQALTSHLNLRAQLELVGDKLLETFGVMDGYIALYDSHTDMIEVPYFREAGGKVTVAPLPLGAGLATVVIRSRQPLLLNEDAERRAADLGAVITGKPAQSYLGVPILIGTEVAGVISIQSTERAGLFTDSDIRLLTTIAANVGAAIRNARLFEETQKRAQQLAVANEIGREATSTLDLDRLLDTSVALIRERFGFYHASVFMVEPGARLAVLRASTGEAGRQLKARRHQLAVGSTSLVGAATATRQPVIVQDVSADPTHFKNPLLPQTRAEAVIPLLSGDTVIGALDVQSEVPYAFGESEAAILTTIADQLAVAVQNARLFDRVSHQAQREKLAAGITNKIRAAGSVDGMLRVAVTELRKALGVTHGAVRLGLLTEDAQPADGAAAQAPIRAARAPADPEWPAQPVKGGNGADEPGDRSEAE